MERESILYDEVKRKSLLTKCIYMIKERKKNGISAENVRL